MHRQREWLGVTLRSIGDAVLATDIGGRVTFLNPVAAALTGWSADEAVGRPVASVFRTIHEQTRQAAVDVVAQVLSQKKVVALANHTALVTKDGREVPIEDSAAPILDAVRRRWRAWCWCSTTSPKNGAGLLQSRRARPRKPRPPTWPRASSSRI